MSCCRALRNTGRSIAKATMTRMKDRYSRLWRGGIGAAE